MITADLKNAAGRLPASPEMGKALDFLRRPNAASLPDGKYEIDGERVFAMVQRYETVTAAPPKFEAHRKYIDVQFMASGTEVIGCAPLEKLEISEVYDSARDVCFGAVPAGEWIPLRLAPGQLAVLWPEDAHAPRLAAGSSVPVIKIVVKVAV
jgi:YhcH/YjgK/YiaL family protein